jgi:phage virion morphogenesis protein
MITIEIDDRSVLEALEQLRHKVSDLSPAMNAIGMEFEARASRRFEDETDPNGKPWAPWAKATRKSYPKDGNRRILDRTGDMLDSLNYQADKDSVTIGFGAVSQKGFPYPAAHEFGTKNMPRRGLLTADPVSRTLGEEDQRSILEILDRYLSP